MLSKISLDGARSSTASGREVLSDNEQSSKFTGLSLTLFFSAESSDLIATASISFGAFANRDSLKAPQLFNSLQKM